MKFLEDRRFIALLRVVLGGVFLAAALPKLRDPEAFAKSIENYHLLPQFAERLLALVLPPLELFVGLFLLLGIVDVGASFLAFALMVVFTSAVASALARGLDISCGCFESEGGAKVGLAKIVENLALTWAAWRVHRGDRSFLSLGALGKARAGATAALACIAAMIAGAAGNAGAAPAKPAASKAAAAKPGTAAPETSVRNTAADLGARPFLWIIEREEPAFLFGTIHLPDPRVVKTPEVVNEAFRACDAFVTEIPLDDATQRRVAEESVRTESETLAMILPGDVREKADRFVARMGFSLAEFAPLEIYSFALQLPLLEYASRPSPPLDAQLHQRATAAGMKLDALETPEEQLAIFEALTREEQIELLRITLEDLDTDGAPAPPAPKPVSPGAKGPGPAPKPSPKVEDMVLAYIAGDGDRLEKDLFGSMRAGGALEKRLLHEMLDVRNVRLADRIDAALRSDPDRATFIAVGAGHMIGSQGIVDRLQSKGWTLRRLGARDIETVRAAAN